MIYDKELSPPAYRRRSVRRELSFFGEQQNAVSAYGLHFKQTARGLVCAEGAELLGSAKTLLPGQGYTARLYEYAGGAVVTPSGERFPFPSEPAAIFCFLSAEGEEQHFALSDDGCFFLKTDGAERIGDGAACGAIHGERLFLAKGSLLRWSAPLDVKFGPQTAQTAGQVALPSADGDILAMLSLKDTLYLFREQGIAVLSVLGDTLGFTARHLPAPCGIVGASVRKCGDGAMFLADNGLYSFDGKQCKLLPASGFSELDLSGTSTAVSDEKYYATALYNGEKCILCVENGQGHLIRARAEKLIGGEKLLFTAGGELFRLTERGLPPMRRKECALRTERSFLGLSARRKFLDGILIEGNGHFRVEAKGERGLPRAVFGKAGEPLRFPLPVRGSGFSFDIRTLDENACIKALVFDLREETATW